MTSDEEELAATKIQALHRGHMTRKALREGHVGGRGVEEEVAGGPPEDEGGCVEESEVDAGADGASSLPGSSLLEAFGDGVLTKKMIVAGLSNLGATTDGNSIAYLKCNISNLNLTSIDGIEGFTHLQDLNVGGNKLASLLPVAKLPNLCTLQAHRNLLTGVLDGIPPRLTLQSIDFSDNCIAQLPDLTPHRFLRVIKLDGNNITEIKGVNQLPYLIELSLNNNKITRIRGLEGSKLRTLRLNNNEINDIEGVVAVRETLKELSLNGNELIHLGGVEEMRSLMKLDIGGNHLRHLPELLRLKGLAYLRELVVAQNPLQFAMDVGNDDDDERTESDVVVEDTDDAKQPPEPVEKIPLYDPIMGPPVPSDPKLLPRDVLWRYQILFNVPQIRILDGTPATSEDKVRANNLLGGADLESRAGNEKRYFGQTVTNVGDPDPVPVETVG